MSVKRYKINKDQLERVVESFVMESAKIESKKAPVKNHIPSQGSEAKKYVKNKINGKMVEKGEGVPNPEKMKKKLSQAPEAKKFISKAKATHSTKAKVVKEDIGEQDVAGLLKSVGLPVNQKVIDYAQKLVSKNPEEYKQALAKAGITSMDDLKSFLEKSKSNVEAKEDSVKKKLAPVLSESINESFLSDNKGKIGVALFGLGLAGLSVIGGLDAHLTDLLSNDQIIKHVATDPLWITSIIGTIFGAGLAIKGKGEADKETALSSWVQMAKKNGFTEQVDNTTYKNPATGKEVKFQNK